jgi:hypothetical protein
MGIVKKRATEERGHKWMANSTGGGMAKSVMATIK